MNLRFLVALDGEEKGLSEVRRPFSALFSFI